MDEPLPPKLQARRVRSIGAVRRRRRLGLLVAALIVLAGLAVLTVALVPRVGLLRRAVLTSGIVADHRSTSGKGPTFTLYVSLPPEIAPRVVAVAVDSETYDRTWIGDRATFYVDPQNPAATSQDPPSALRLAGFVLAALGLTFTLLLPVFGIAWDLTPEQAKERNFVRESADGTLEITEARPSVTQPPAHVVSGRTVDASGKRWKVERLRVGAPVAVGDRIPILIAADGRHLRAITTLAAFEPAPPRTP